MTDYTKLVKALRIHTTAGADCDECSYYDDCRIHGNGQEKMIKDAAAAIEALQAEVQSYKALADEWQESAESKERLLGLYRTEQAKRFYSAMDNNGRIIANPCACMNIPVFPDGSESPNS